MDIFQYLSYLPSFVTTFFNIFSNLGEFFFTSVFTVNGVDYTVASLMLGAGITVTLITAITKFFSPIS